MGGNNTLCLSIKLDIERRIKMAYGSLNIKDDIVTTISTLPSPPP